jgi:GTP-binding protein HflX
MLPNGRALVLTDTVGFIRRMPKDLFAAFRATFEEASDADVIVEVVDVSDAEHEEHLTTTREILSELGLELTPRLRVFNKADRLGVEERAAFAREALSVCVSALDKQSVAPLLTALSRLLPAKQPSPEDSAAAAT